jgi:hypothetical protein
MKSKQFFKPKAILRGDFNFDLRLSFVVVKSIIQLKIFILEKVYIQSES